MAFISSFSDLCVRRVDRVGKILLVECDMLFMSSHFHDADLFVFNWDRVFLRWPKMAGIQIIAYHAELTDFSSERFGIESLLLHFLHIERPKHLIDTFFLAPPHNPRLVAGDDGINTFISTFRALYGSHRRKPAFECLWNSKSCLCNLVSCSSCYVPVCVHGRRQCFLAKPLLLDDRWISISFET